MKNLQAEKELRTLDSVEGIPPTVASGVALTEKSGLIELSLYSGKAPTSFRIFRAGENHTRKGVFVCSQASVGKCMSAFAEHGNDLAIDYDHAMLDGSSDPLNARRAAGWFKLAANELNELWAIDVQWTPRAREAIEAKEFRYISPAFLSEGGEVTKIINVAITNLPASDHLTPLVASQTPKAEQKDNSMNTDKQVQTGREEVAAELLSVTGKATTSEAVGVVLAWKAAAEKLQTLSEDFAKVTAELDAIKTERAAVEVRAVVDEAIKAGKAVPAQSEILLSMGMRDIAQLKAFVDASPVIALSTRTEKKPDAAAIVALSDEAKKMAAQFGLDPKKLAGVEMKIGEQLENEKE